MRLDVFEKVISLMISHSNRSFELNKLGVDLINYDEELCAAISLLIRGHYGEAGADWVEWYLYERDNFDGSINEAHDDEGRSICYDVPSLWSHVEELRNSDDFKEYSLSKKKSSGPADFEALFGNLF